MARKATGQVIPPKGRQKSWAIRFPAYGQRHYQSGFEDEEAARAELAYVLEAVARGDWRPPEPDPIPVEVAETAANPGFEEFARRWLEDLQLEGLRPNTVADYQWQLESHLLPFFSRHRLDRITIAEVDRYRRAKVRDSELSATSINKTITRLAQILDIAVEQELIARNPARGKRRRLKQSKPKRTFLDRADQIESLLAAAGELDDEAREDRRATARRTLLATLVFAGPRITEALALRQRDVDLSAGRIHILDSKTDAGVRQVTMLPALRDELATLKAKAAAEGRDAPDRLVFATKHGNAENPSNVRNRVLAKAVKRANERRDEAGLAPLPEGLTPHSLRRTFISLLLAIGDDVPYVMREVGHVDPKVTLGIYAQVMYQGDGERARLRKLTGRDASGRLQPNRRAQARGASRNVRVAPRSA